MSKSTAAQRPIGLPSIDAAEISEHLAQRRTLPAVLYTDSAILQLERELIFRRCWQVVGTIGELADPGAYLTTDVGGVPVVVVRDHEGRLGAFVNVCRHRASPVAEGSGSCKRLTCGYHGWTYGLDGSLKGVAQRKAGNLPPAETLGLHRLHVDTFGGLVFVSLEPQESLAEQLGDVPALLEQASYDFPFADPDFGLYPFEKDAHYETEVRANWKSFMENGIECYHCATVHPQTLCVAAVPRLHFRLSATGKFGAVAGIPLRDEWKAKFVAGDKQGSQDAFAVYAIWPNAIIASGYLGEHIFRYEPMSPGVTRIIARGYGRPDILSEPLHEILRYLGPANAEDFEILEKVQRGLASGYVEPGPLMGEPEEVVHAFHRQVWQVLGPVFAQ